jgi:tRNA G46 methylase TrmB
MDWGGLLPAHFPKTTESQVATKDMEKSTLSKQVEIADIGCGFGGLLFGLAPVFPDTLIVGRVFKYYTSTLSSYHTNKTHQAWRFGHQSRNLYKKRSKP